MWGDGPPLHRGVGEHLRRRRVRRRRGKVRVRVRRKRRIRRRRRRGSTVARAIAGELTVMEDRSGGKYCNSCNKGSESCNKRSES